MPGDATAWVTYSVWMERLRGADGAEDIIMRGFREGHKELSKTARALLTQRIALLVLALHSAPETRNGQEHMPKQHTSRIDTTRNVRWVAHITWEELGRFLLERSE